MEKHPNRQKTQKYTALSDERLVKRPLTSYVFFAMERRATGDYAGMTIQESSTLMGKEWKQLSAAEKQVSKQKLLQQSSS